MKTLRPYQQESVNETLKMLRKSDAPVAFVMSVGGGKSLCISEILLFMQRKGRKALCLVNSSELVRNNSQAFIEQGGECSIFCASLNQKDISASVIFATPQSVGSAISRNHPLKDIQFNLIVVDECHMIPYDKDNSVFMKIIRHYKQDYQKMRLLGLTGTPYRGKSVSIVGNECLFKTATANITMPWLIKKGYLVTPYFGLHEIDGIDYSSLDVKSNGEFNKKQLAQIAKDNYRLTGHILDEVQGIMRDRQGAFIFCATVNHCQEAAQSLPKELTRIITGETPDHERHESLSMARNGHIKYLLSVNCLMTGIDVPNFDSVVWLRPTESLTLFTQGIGRGLRLHPDKQNGLILDYAGNLDRFRDFDDPIINEAIKPKPANEHEYCIPCLDCNTMNTIYSRRCIGVHEGKRCENYFEFKDCPSCGAFNDIVSRHCRSCDFELLDPNRKLSLNHKREPVYTVSVLEATFWISSSQGGQPIFHAKYKTKCNLNIYESFFCGSQKGLNIFWGKFAKEQIMDASKYYAHLDNDKVLRHIVSNGFIHVPFELDVIYKLDKYQIVKKHFHSHNAL